MASPSCPTCVVPDLQPEYPPWRRNIATAILVAHVFILLTAGFVAFRFRKYPLMNMRDPHFLIIMWIGVLTAGHTAVREIMGESHYPCIAHYILTAVTTLCLAISTLIRTLRLVAMHCLQSRVKKLVLKHSSENLLSTDVIHESDPSNRDITTSDLEIPTQNTTGETKETDVQVGSARLAEPAVPAAAGRRSLIRCSRMSTHRHMQTLLLDILHLHTPKGQLCLWAVFAVVQIVATAVSARYDGKFVMAPGYYGCSFTDRTGLVNTFATTGIIFLVELPVFLYVIKKPDSYGYREEILALGCILLVGCVLVSFFRSSSAVYSVTSPNYAVLGCSWILVAVTYMLPAWRAARLSKAVARRVMPDPVAPVVCKDETVVDVMTVGIKDEEVMLGVPRVQPVGADSSMKKCPWPEHDRHLCVHLSTLVMNVPSLVCDVNEETQDGLCSQIETELNSALSRDALEPHGRNLEVLCLYLCSTAEGRRVLRKVLAQEWSTELLLFVLDAAYFSMTVSDAIQACQQFGRDQPASIVRKAVFRAGDAAIAAAEHMVAMYMSGTAMIPVRVSKTSIASAARNVSHARDKWKKIAVDVDPEDEAVVLVAFFRSIAPIFYDIELQTLRMVMRSAIVCFIFGDSYDAWRAQVQLRFRGMYQNTKQGWIGDELS